MFKEEDREILEKCPWCGAGEYTDWGEAVRGFCSVRCGKCSLIYIKNRFNQKGLEKFYERYLSNVHQADKELNEKRGRMYTIEFDLINTCCAQGEVLDVGCSGGYFLDHFKKAGFKCYGVEFGREASKEAAKKHQVYFGDFAELEIDVKFDLIMFRGVIEHTLYPKTYLQKAMRLLKEGGFIYITSTPNSESFCCKLFLEQWNQHEPEGHLMHFNARHFDDLFKANGFKKAAEYYYYEETPYADTVNDIELVAKAITLHREGKRIDFRSPPFYRNMMSLIYKKDCK